MTRQGPQGRSSVWRTVKAVLWSFLGIRRRKDFHEDVSQLKPLHLMVAGVILTFVFVIGLMVLVNVVAG
ncbi:DUF2970 domain-containing protein [Hydrogenophaga aquatica]